MSYTPANPPYKSDAREVAQWCYREFERIRDALRTYDALRMNPLAVEPAKPRKGDVVYADGSSWDPGSGEGVYAYDGAVWNKL